MKCTQSTSYSFFCITVEEPHKRKGPVQCTDCQEYGHTRAYCTLRPVCVICGELHDSAYCMTNKSDPNTKKCGNCGGNHTANYRGCPIYKDLKSRLHPRITSQNRDLLNLALRQPLYILPKLIRHRLPMQQQSNIETMMHTL